MHKVAILVRSFNLFNYVEILKHKEKVHFTFNLRFSFLLHFSPEKSLLR